MYIILRKNHVSQMCKSDMMICAFWIQKAIIGHLTGYGMLSVNINNH